jgi:hypothetical protein
VRLEAVNASGGGCLRIEQTGKTKEARSTQKEEKAEVENGFLERDEHKTLWQTCMDGADT